MALLGEIQSMGKGRRTMTSLGPYRLFFQPAKLALWQWYDMVTLLALGPSFSLAKINSSRG